ncbi:hypothetical protein CVS40_11818 [Lucilia cuprina]|nr:hypothetical protein CVS40_11818 [Lucilia cuprina]
MGRLQEVIKGDDVVVRVTVIKTVNGIIRRAVSKICIPFNDDIESSRNSMGAGCLGLKKNTQLILLNIYNFV